MILKEISALYGVDARLLKRYFQAFANLYGICPLQKALQIINLQNPEHRLTRLQLLGFADNYRGEWKLVSPDEVYSNLPTTAPMQREIVSNQLVFYGDYGGYDYIRAQQANKDYYVPQREELLKYANREYYEETPCTAAMARLLHEKLRAEDWQRKLLEIILNLRFDSFNMQDFADMLEPEHMSLELTQEAIGIYVELHNNSRLMSNRGYTPHELSDKNHSQGAWPTAISFGPGMQKLIQNEELAADELAQGFAAMNIPAGLKQNLLEETEKAKHPPGRNDPCPCGSGKKYKKCCGR